MRKITLLILAFLVPLVVVSPVEAADLPDVTATAYCVSPTNSNKRIEMKTTYDFNGSDNSSIRVRQMTARPQTKQSGVWRGDAWLQAATAYLDYNGVNHSSYAFQNPGIALIGWQPQTGFSNRYNNYILSKFSVSGGGDGIVCSMSDDYYLP